jgi:hypothetical protein
MVSRRKAADLLLQLHLRMAGAVERRRYMQGMQCHFGQWRIILRHLFRMSLGLAALAWLALASHASIADDRKDPLVVSIQNAVAKVGEPTTIFAKVTVDQGWQVAKSYRNRIIELSSFDDGVDFEKGEVPGSLEGSSLVFAVGVTSTKPGAHAINGVFRVGYHNGERLKMVSIPLIATVTGTE